MFKQGGKIKMILFFVLTGSFYCPSVFLHSSESAHLRISEVAWMGSINSSNDEWVELFNAGEIDVVLEGWTLRAEDGRPGIELAGVVKAGEYFLLERTDDESAPEQAADMIYSGALGNMGEFLELRNEAGELIDRLDAGSGWPAGDNDTKQTMSLLEENIWRNSAHPGGTPGKSNDFAEVNESEELTEDLDEDSLPGTEGEESDPERQSIGAGGVVINELVSDPVDGDSEWVELYNKTGAAVVLDGWKIKEGSGQGTLLSGIIGFEGQDRYLVVEGLKGNLNNPGDTVGLYDQNDRLINSVSYGDWDEGKLSDNAPAAKDPASLARLTDGLDSGNNAVDFSVTWAVTKGVANVIAREEKLDGSIKDTGAEKKAVRITEAYPNPPGKDTFDEFIELFNFSDKIIDLCGWEVGDSQGDRYKIDKEDVKGCRFYPKSYLSLYRQKTGLALDNNGDVVWLFSPGRKTAINKIAYLNAPVGRSFSLAMDEQGREYGYKWMAVTPGRKNIIHKEPEKLDIDFSFPQGAKVGQPIFFDSSDIKLHEKKEYFYLWDFGDGFGNSLSCPEHVFFGPGEFAVSLSVGNKDGTTTIERLISIDPGADMAANEKHDDQSGHLDLVINELLPDPVGLDPDGEFVEIYNKADSVVNLYNWQVDDEESGSKPFVFSKDIWLDAGDYYVLERQESKLALNNDQDSVRLFNVGKTLVDEVDYENPVEGYAYARGENDKWFWTSVPTPQKNNIIKVSDQASYAGEVLSSGFGATSIKKVPEAKEEYRGVELFEINEGLIGAKVRATGTVLVSPGVLGTQIFYMSNGRGVQVYSYKKDFPDIKPGYLVAVSGEISASNGEFRIKTKNRDDIVVMEVNEESPLPKEMECEKINDKLMGELVSVHGELVERKGASIFVDDGTGEVRVYIKTSTDIEPGSYEEGDELVVTGVVSKTSAGLRLLPRGVDDIYKKEGDHSQDGAVLGEVAVSDEWVLEERNSKMKIFKYLAIVLFSAALAFFWFSARK